ncbi:MAG: hypothetical protein HYY13_08020, partial [Nitrospirae bacterium]|nr:hypothetical protein [Nitrospirota bacterium]
TLVYAPPIPFIETFDYGLPADWWVMLEPPASVQSLPGEVRFDTSLIPQGQPGNMVIAGQPFGEAFTVDGPFTISAAFEVDAITGPASFGFDMFDPTQQDGASFGKFYSHGGTGGDQSFMLVSVSPEGEETVVVDPTGMEAGPGTRWTFELSYIPDPNPDLSRLVGRAIETDTQTLISEQTIQPMVVDFPVIVMVIAATAELGGDPEAPLPEDTQITMRVDSIVSDFVTLPQAYGLSRAILQADETAYEFVPVPEGRPPLGKTGVLFVGDPALTEVPISPVATTPTVVQGVDGTQDVHAYLVTDPAPEPDALSTIYSPLDEAILRSTLADHGYATTFVVDHYVASIFLHKGSQVDYLWSLRPPWEPPPMPPPKPIAVAEGYGPIGSLVPVASPDQPFTDTFDDQDVWWDNWTNHYFSTLSRSHEDTILEPRGETLNDYLIPRQQPGYVVQSAGKLITEAVRQYNGVVASRAGFGLEGLQFEVTLTPYFEPLSKYNGLSYGQFTVGIGHWDPVEPGPWQDLVCKVYCDVWSDTTVCTFMPGGRNWSTNTWAQGTKVTANWSLAGGVGKFWIHELNIPEDVPLEGPCETEVEEKDEETGETRMVEKIGRIVLASWLVPTGDQKTPHAYVVWDDLAANEPPARAAALYASSPLPLLLDGVPYQDTDFTLSFNLQVYASAALGLPLYQYLWPPEGHRLFEDVAGRYFGGVPGPPRGHWLAPLEEDLKIYPVGWEADATAFVNMDGTPVAYISGEAPVHALFWTDPSSGKKATVYGEAPLDPVIPWPQDEPLIVMAPEGSDPTYQGIDAVAVNVFTPILDGEGEPTGAYRFRLPQVPPDLTGISVPPAITVRVADGDPLPKTVGDYPSACLRQDGSMQLHMPDLVLGYPSDPFQAIAVRAAMDRLCIKPAMYATSHDTVAAIVQGQNAPALEARSFGEATITADLEGHTAASAVRVVSVPPLSLGVPTPEGIVGADSDPQEGGSAAGGQESGAADPSASGPMRIGPYNRPVGADSDPSDLLQFVSADADRLELSIHQPQTATYTVKAQHKVVLQMEGVVSACESYSLSDKAQVLGPVIYPVPPETCALYDAVADNFILTARKRNDNDQVEFPPGSIDSAGNLTLDDEDFLQLPRGIYYFASVTIKERARIGAEQGTRIVVAGAVTLSDSASAGRRIKWFVDQGPIVLSGESKSVGGFLAPGASVSLTERARMFGLVFAKDYSGSGTSLLTIDEERLPVPFGVPLVTHPDKSRVEVAITLNYKAVALGPYGIDPPVVGETALELRDLVVLRGDEPRDGEGFVTVQFPVAFDGRDAEGNPLPTPDLPGYQAYAPDAAIEYRLCHGSEQTVLGSVSLTDGLLLVDNLPPALNVLTPLPDAQTIFTSARLLAFTDDPSQSGTIFLNDLPTPDSRLTGLLLSTDPLYPPPMPEGPNTWSLTATDPLGNPSTLDLTQTLDSRPPLITITTPSPNFATNQPTLTLEFDVSDEVSGPDAASITVTRSGSLDGSSETLLPTCSPSDPLTVHCSLLAPLHEGTNSLHIAASDLAGNASSTGTVVKNDTTPPEIRLYPLNGDYLAEQVLDPYASAGNYCAPVGRPRVVFRIYDPEPSGTVYDIESASASYPKGYLAKLPAEGFVGPLASGFDLDKLEVSIVDDRLVQGEPVTLYCTGGSIQSCEIPGGLPEGCLDLSIRIFDYAGNDSVVTQTFILDRTPPDVAIAHEPADIYQKANQLAYTITYTESLPPDGCACGINAGTHAEEGYRRVLFYNNEYGETDDVHAPAQMVFTRLTRVPLEIPGLNFAVGDLELKMEYDVTFQEGKAQIRGKVLDFVGYEGKGSDDVIVDQSYPAPVSDPPNGAILSSPPLLIALLPSEVYPPGFPDPNPLDPPGQPQFSSGLSEAEIRLTIDGAPTALLQVFHDHPYLTNQATSVMGTLTSGQQTEGSHTIEATLPDRAGNVTFFTSTYCQDAQPPVVTIDAPYAGQVFNFMPLQLDANVSDPQPGCGMDWISVAPPNNIIEGPFIEGERVSALMNFGIGTQTITVLARDKAGHVTTGARIFDVVPVDPEIGAFVAPPGVGATLYIPPGALQYETVPILTDFSLDDAIALVGEGVFGPPGLGPFGLLSEETLTYVGGANAIIGGQTTDALLEPCVLKESGYVYPSDRQVLVVRSSGMDGNGDDNMDLIVVDGTYDSDPRVCAARLASFPGMFTGDKYMVADLPDPSVVLVGDIPEGYSLKPHPQACKTASFFTLQPGAGTRWAFPVCKSELPTFAIDIVDEDTGKTVGYVEGFEDSDGDGVIEVPDCDLDEGSLQAVSFPEEKMGGPPDELSAAEEEYPSFEVDYSGAITDSLDVEQSIGGMVDRSNGESAAAKWIHRGHSRPGGSRLRLPSTYIGGITANTREDEGARILTLSVWPLSRADSGEATCSLLGPSSYRYPAVRPSTSPGDSPAGAHDAEWGAAQGVLIYPLDHEQGVPEYCYGDGAEVDGRPCFIEYGHQAGGDKERVECRACDPGMTGLDAYGKPRIDALGCGSGWFDPVDPSTCRVSRLQNRFMRMKRAGLSMVTVPTYWREMEPLKGAVPHPFDRVPNDGWVDGGDDEKFVDMDAYVVMAKRYGFDLGSLLGAGPPYWASSCCLSFEWWDRDLCLRSDLSKETVETQCLPTCDAFAGYHRDWYNRERAGYLGPTEACETSTDCAYKLENQCVPPVIAGCALTGVWLNCAPDQDDLAAHVARVVQYFRPNGTLATRMGWGFDYGITSWEFNEEHNSSERFAVLTDLRPTEGPGSPGDPHGWPGTALIYSPQEYKRLFKRVSDTIWYDVIGSDIWYDLKTRVVIGGPHASIDWGDCPSDDSDNEWFWEGQGEDRLVNLGVGCFNSLDTGRFYEVMDAPTVPPGEGYRIDISAFPRMPVLGLQGFQAEGPSIEEEALGRGNVHDVLVTLTTNFPNHELWMMNFASHCDPLTDPGADCGGGLDTAPGPYAQAAYGAGLLAMMPGTIAKRALWFGFSGLEGGQPPMLIQIPTQAPLFKPSYHALAVAPRIEAVPGRDYEFRTGLELGGNLPRAYLQIVLDEGRSYHLNTCAKVLDVACKPLGSPEGCYDPCQSAGDPGACRDAYAQVAG